MFEKISLKIIKEWALGRLKERSSWDGTVILAIAVAVIMSVPFVEMLAWAGLAYGIWTIIKKEFSIKDLDKDGLTRLKDSIIRKLED